MASFSSLRRALLLPREQQKAEVRRLEDYLNQILENVEQRAPAIQKLQDDYNALQQENATFRKTNEDLNKTYIDIDRDTNLARKNAKFLQRDRDRLQQTTEDLSKQIQSLLQENQQLRGGASDFDSGMSNDLNTTADVISSQLVSVESIADMQEQNTKLREALRALGDERETEERVKSEEALSELEGRLTAALEQLGEMQEARKRQMEMADALAKQRDMFKALYNELCASSGADGAAVIANNIIASPGPAVAGPGSAKETKELLAQLHDDFENYRKEAATNNKIKDAEFGKIQNDGNSLRSENARLSAKVDGLHTQGNDLRASMDAQEKELDHYRKQNRDYSATVAKLQQSMQETETAKVDVAAQLRRAVFDKENAINEKKLASQSEQRLSQQLTLLMKDREAQTNLMTNLQTIQNNLKRLAEDDQNRLQAQAKELQEELTSTRKRLDQAQERSSTASTSRESAKLEHIDLMKEEQKSHQKTRDECIKLNAQAEDLRRQVEEKQKLYESSEIRVNVLLQQNGEADSADNDQKEQLKNAMDKMATLQAELAAAKEHSTKFESLASTAEARLKDINKSSDDYKKAADEQRKRLSDQVAETKKALALAEEKCAALVTKCNQLEADVAQAKKGHEEGTAKLQEELAAARKAEEETKMLHTQLQSDCERYTQQVADASNKYNRELQLHAAAAEQLTQAKSKAEELGAKAAELEAAKNTAEESLQSAEASWKEQQRAFEAQVEKEKDIAEDEKKQRELLKRHLASAQDDLLKLQTDKMPALNDADSSLGESVDLERRVADLMELNRYESKQTEIAQTEKEQIKLEVVRYKQLCEQRQRQLEDTKKLLDDERERMQTHAITAEKHGELMKKVDTLNRCEDSNRLLRAENDKCDGELKELKAKLGKLTEQVVPLQQSQRELEKQLEQQKVQNVVKDNEIKMWKDRTTELKRVYARVDPEELEKAQKDLAAAKVTEAKAKLMAANAKKELAAAKTSQASSIAAKNKLEEEKKALADQVAGKVEEIAQNAQKNDNMIKRLKEVGKNYRTKFQDSEKKLKEAAGKLAATETQQAADTANAGANTAATEQVRAELTAKIEAITKQLMNAKEQAAQCEVKCNQLEQQASAQPTPAAGTASTETSTTLEDAQKKIADLEQNIKDLNENIAKLNATKSKLMKVARQFKKAKEVAEELCNTRETEIVRLNAQLGGEAAVPPPAVAAPVKPVTPAKKTPAALPGTSKTPVKAKTPAKQAPAEKKPVTPHATAPLNPKAIGRSPLNPQAQAFDTKAAPPATQASGDLKRPRENSISPQKHATPPGAAEPAAKKAKETAAPETASAVVVETAAPITVVPSDAAADSTPAPAEAEGTAATAATASAVVVPGMSATPVATDTPAQETGGGAAGEVEADNVVPEPAVSEEPETVQQPESQPVEPISALRARPGSLRLGLQTEFPQAASGELGDMITSPPMAEPVPSTPVLTVPSSGDGIGMVPSARLSNPQLAVSPTPDASAISGSAAAVPNENQAQPVREAFRATSDSIATDNGEHAVPENPSPVLEANTDSTVPGSVDSTSDAMQTASATEQEDSSVPQASSEEVADDVDAAQAPGAADPIAEATPVAAQSIPAAGGDATQRVTITPITAPTIVPITAPGAAASGTAASPGAAKRKASNPNLSADQKKARRLSDAAKKVAQAGRAGGRGGRAGGRGGGRGGRGGGRGRGGAGNANTAGRGRGGGN